MKSLLTVVMCALCCLTSLANTDKINEVVILLEAADSLHSIGRTDSAVVVGQHAVTLANECNEPTLIVGANSATGVYLRSLGKIDEALESYGAALEIITSGQFRENPDQDAIEEIASLYINLAVLDLDMQHKDEAAKNALLSAEWIAKSEDPELRSTIYGVVGSVLTGCGDLENALRYQDLAYQDALASDNTDSAFRAAAYTMLIADRLGNKADAQVWREKCQSLLPDIEAMMTRLLYYQAECSIALKNDNAKDALVWFNKILELDGIDNLPFIKFDCYNNMHIAYAGLGDFENAYNVVLQSNELRDSIWEEEKAESLRDLTVKYETKETQLALAQSEARRANTLMWLFAAAALLLVGVIAFIVYANRQRRRRLQKEMEFAALRADIGQQLTAQYIEGLENERRRMSRELHDGVCNDLLAIQMNISNGQSIDTTARLIDSCRESVRRISHELMPPEFAYATIDEVIRYYVAKQAEANKEHIALSYTSAAVGRDWTSVPDSVALEVYRIVQEAVGNAVRHSGASEIIVRLELSSDGLSLTVNDNGTFVAASRKGLGLDSMRRRANSINGSVSIESGNGAGTEVHMTVKI
ncbi:MAG: sensor histidine kinase [Muribaculaceae bacterium]|nr:sensor histidine kinase [Muribaculaceae bacterium]